MKLPSTESRPSDFCQPPTAAPAQATPRTPRPVFSTCGGSPCGSLPRQPGCGAGRSTRLIAAVVSSLATKKRQPVRSAPVFAFCFGVASLFQKRCSQILSRNSMRPPTPYVLRQFDRKTLRLLGKYVVSKKKRPGSTLQAPPLSGNTWPATRAGVLSGFGCEAVRKPRLPVLKCHPLGMVFSYLPPFLGVFEKGPISQVTRGQFGFLYTKNSKKKII